jgi:hypothetical protein
MPTFHVYYEKRTSKQCYVEVEADDENDAANKAKELISESDDPLVEIPESYHVETNEIGQVEKIDGDLEG